MHASRWQLNCIIILLLMSFVLQLKIWMDFASVIYLSRKIAVPMLEREMMDYIKAMDRNDKAKEGKGK